MMNALKKTACALTILATTSTAVMAESIDVKVIGTITPTACNPTLTGGGTIDYGIIQPKSLKKDSLNQLDIKSVDFSITCDAPAKVGVRAINQRPNTAAGVSGDDTSGATIPAGLGGKNGSIVVGLGLSDGKKIGGYTLTIRNSNADGNKVDDIYKATKATSWLKHGTTQSFLGFDGINSWSKPGTLDPIAFTTLAGKLNVQAYINKASELDLSKPVKLDGLTTLELVYL